MSATRILQGLERSPATGPEADTAARLGFLEWAFTGPEAITPEAAADALRLTRAQCPGSAAARAFVAYLEQATRPMTGARRRRARQLH